MRFSTLLRTKEGYYVRDPERDCVYCPGGEGLRKKSIKKNGATRYANKRACSKCPFREKCITGNTKWKELDFSKDMLEKCAKWCDHQDDAEHPFGTIKRALGAVYFLLKSKRKVGGEFALMAT